MSEHTRSNWDLDIMSRARCFHEHLQRVEMTPTGGYAPEVLPRLAARARSLRTQQGRSLQDLADYMGVDIATLEAFEEARRWVGLHTLAAISLVLDVPPQSFFEEVNQCLA